MVITVVVVLIATPPWQQTSGYELVVVCIELLFRLSSKWIYTHFLAVIKVFLICLYMAAYRKNDR